MRNQLLFSTLLLAIALTSSRPAVADQSATDLGRIGNYSSGHSEAYAVIDDGSVVVGNAFVGIGSDTIQAFRWAQSDGMVDIGDPGTIVSPYQTKSEAYAVSADGSVVAGSLNYHAARWTQATGMVDIGTLGGSQSVAKGISTDGSILTGYADTASFDTHAFRWTQAGGMVDLGTLGGLSSYGYGISADGAIIVGQSYEVTNTYLRAFRWTQAGGMVDIGTLGGNVASANATSSDGSVVVGGSYLSGDSLWHAFRWTQAGGMVDLNPSGGTSDAAAVSGDGSIVVGSYNTLYGDQAFRWTQATGMKKLNDLLVAAGVDMTNINLKYAYGISPNGRYIVGQGNFGSNPEAFLVLYDASTTSPPSSPSTPSTPIAGVTTVGGQVESAFRLSDDRLGAMIRNCAQESNILGIARPVSSRSYVEAGVSYCEGILPYLMGQASNGEWTALAGISWGGPSERHVAQSESPTFSGTLRYTFNNLFRKRGSKLKPYLELNGWATPEETLTMKRGYLNGAAPTSGVGDANASAFAGYARAGLILDITPSNRLVGYGEVGRQYLSVSSYDEGYGPSNPFPATVDGGMLWLNIARAGGKWTHEFKNWSYAPSDEKAMPVTLTIAAAAAHSFDNHTNLTASLAGAGIVTTGSKDNTWGEFGARLSLPLTKRWSLGADMSAITGADPVGTSIYGGGLLIYSF